MCHVAISLRRAPSSEKSQVLSPLITQLATRWVNHHNDDSFAINGARYRHTQPFVMFQSSHVSFEMAAYSAIRGPLGPLGDGWNRPAKDELAFALAISRLTPSFARGGDGAEPRRSRLIKCKYKQTHDSFSHLDTANRLWWQPASSP